MRGWVTVLGGEMGLKLAADLPEPEPADNEAVIEVRAYSVNRASWD